MFMTNNKNRQSKLSIKSILFCSAFFIASSVYADTFIFDDNNQAAINNQTSCAQQDGGTNAGTVIANIVRTFNVTNHFEINDLNVGFLATHSWRGDIELTLTSPQGTSVILLIPDTALTGDHDNWDVALDDEAPGPADNDLDDNVAAPNFANDRSGLPNNALSVFDGEDAFGDWVLSVCDQFPTSDNGNYLASQLLFDGNPIVDLAISKTSSSSTYTPGQQLVYTLVVTNNGPENANGLTVTDNLPSGLTLVLPVNCVATGNASCGGSGSYGAIGDVGFSDTAASVDAGAGNFLTYTVTVLPSIDMNDY